MNSLLDKLYDGLDKQGGGVYHMGDSHWNIEGLTLTKGLSLSFRKSDIDELTKSCSAQ